MNLSLEKFNEFVGEAYDSLPETTKAKLHNVAILSDYRPTPEQLKKTDKKNGFTLLGLYEGHIQSRRLNFGTVLPDTITLFCEPIAANCRTLEECRQLTLKILKHEIAHHFGSDEIGAHKAEKKVS